MNYLDIELKHLTFRMIDPNLNGVFKREAFVRFHGAKLIELLFAVTEYLKIQLQIG